MIRMVRMIRSTIPRLFALGLLCASGCTLDALFFGYQRQEGPYTLPSSIIPLDRHDQGLFLAAADGTRVHVIAVPPSGADPKRAGTAILFCHGNGGNLGTSRHWQRVEAFYQMGYGVLVFDYRGYGRSEGQPTEDGVYQDGEAALAHLKAQLWAPRIALYGHSLGAAVCTELAQRHAGQLRALILEAPFRSADDLVKDSARASLNAGYVTDLRFDNYAKIDHIGAPLFVMHGTDDTYLPPRYGQALYEHARDPKALWLVEGADHVSIPATEGTPGRTEYMQKVSGFLDRQP